MKFLTSIVMGAALIAAPVASYAQGHGGHGGGGGGGFHGGGGGGFHGGGGGGFRGGGGGGYRGGGGYHGGGYRGGGYRGGWGGYGWGSPFFYGAGLGLYLGYYDNPWYWGYPGYGYYDYPDADDVPPPAYGNGYAPGPYSYDGAPPVAASPPQACGSWRWGQADRQYHWVTNGCN